MDKSDRIRKSEPQWLIAVAFAAAIAVGGVLLSLPVANTSGTWGSFPVPFFLAASAVCVTGLTPVDIHSVLTPFGQLVLLCLMQLGGLGIMTMGSVLFEVIGHNLSMSNEQILASSLGAGTPGRIKQLLWKTIVFTAFWEFAGAVVIGARLFTKYGYNAAKSTYYGIFHSVSAFCNAGFSLYSDSLTGFSNDRLLLFMFAVLIITGGLGFIVHSNLISVAPWRRNKLRRGRYTLHTRIVLTGTVILIATGLFMILAFEWHNSLADVPVNNRFANALFISVSARTAGLNNIDVASMCGLSKAVIMFLMFIGAAPGSTAGGIKVSTAVVLVATVAAMIRNRRETEYAGRTIPARAVRESIVITVLSAAIVLIAVFVLHFTEASNPALAAAPQDLSLNLTFEAVSAFGTVGLSLDTTPLLSNTGLLCIMVCMFIGRLGPLTLALIMSGAEPTSDRRFPEENVVVG